MWVAATVMLVVMAPAQKNEAEDLFKKMDEKVQKAKSIQYEADSVLEGPIKGNMDAKVTLAEGNKGHFAMTMDFAGMKQSMKAISDGKNSRNGQGDKLGKAEETPKHLSAGFATILSRTGIGGVMMGRGNKDDDPLKADKFDADKIAKVSDLKLGKKEKVGDIEAQVLTYTVEMNTKKFPITVWVDPKTSLPVKRVVEINEGGQMMKLTETIKNFKVDEKVDAKLFELPKD